MFTIKFYGDDGYRMRVIEAESFTVLRPQLTQLSGDIEITCHGVRLNGEMVDERIDLTSINSPRRHVDESVFFTKAIVENANGKTTEILYSDSEFARRAA